MIKTFHGLVILFLFVTASSPSTAQAAGIPDSSYLPTNATRNSPITPDHLRNVTSIRSENAALTYIYLPLVKKDPLPPLDWQPGFPIRAAFYYPWFPEAWDQLNIFPYTNYTPKLGYYNSSDQALLKQHIAMMQYAHIDAAIASWWGPGSRTDAKIASLLSASDGMNFRWSLYYENESMGNPSASQIHTDLVYIRDHYGTNPNFLRINGKFVVFVYADGGDTCGMADRWKQANTVGAYVVLKVFPGFSQCASQPDSWHQYCPAVPEDSQGVINYSISPGFWLKGNAVRLGRDITRWKQNVRNMVASGAQWQLITTFNEWGEGTAVEPATEWASPSGYGLYLDALHNNGETP